MTEPGIEIRPTLHACSRWFAPFMLVLITGLTACTPNAQVGAGPQKQTRLTVGQIKEIRMQGPADSTVLLSASSDNSEVVDVSQKPELAMPNGSVRSATGERIFLIKGVTIGLARVVFSEKRSGETGDGQVRRTYLVQVVSK
ncbi:MAG: hypothetical protein H7Z72_06355 [Bacteroidetes bacterium]|nr:hypothetical protein [Fibrella sp.]